MHVRQRKRSKKQQKLSYADSAKNKKFCKCVFSCEEVMEPREIPIRGIPAVGNTQERKLTIGVPIN
ncbi:hypothetical protein HPB47_000148 [Ixodes persulcatus]|uniref:Uncharacterized protein n=1 Tax=Ixodes persulcatus TaxID=34615 RepID=A0AC60PU66_IXOPE|nr:hypothetical protein HPB47_000148 [Ixodes persulcatus]